jgi:hypothetical protein
MRTKVMGKKERQLQDPAIFFSSCPSPAVEFKIVNGLDAKFRWLDNPDLTNVRKICTKTHSMLKGRNINAYTGVITVEVSGETVHFIFWDINDLPSLIKNVKNYSKIYLHFAHEVVYDGHCWGHVTGRGTILDAVLQKYSPKLFALVRNPQLKLVGLQRW